MGILDEPHRPMTYEEMEKFWEMIEEDHPWTPFYAKIDDEVLKRAREAQNNRSNTTNQMSDN